MQHPLCFVAGTSWRGQLREETYLHYNYNPAIFGFGWGPTIHINIPHVQTWAENTTSQVFAPFLILNWECLGVWRRWKRASSFQPFLGAWQGKMHWQACGSQGSTCMGWKFIFSIGSFCVGPHSITEWIWGVWVLRKNMIKDAVSKGCASCR